jgi:hypothetical protein
MEKHWKYSLELKNRINSNEEFRLQLKEHLLNKPKSNTISALDITLENHALDILLSKEEKEEYIKAFSELSKLSLAEFAIKMGYNND